MELTVGPNQFFWSSEDWSALYDGLASAPVDRVILGELVCSKRLPFYQDAILPAIETLIAVGKEVALTTLSLITLKRELKASMALAEVGVDVEINDLTALSHLPEGAKFSVGPLVNVYNEGTLGWLAKRGATRICLPPELPLASVAALCAAGAEAGIAIEVWGHGRIPLAISGRCYHARLHGRMKDNCLFACEDDPDGLQVDTSDGQPFLSMNGVQTLSDSCVSMAHHVEALRDVGVSALRLSPQSVGFVDTCSLYRQRLNDEIDGDTLADELRRVSNGMRLSDGFLTGARGADWSGKAA